MHAEAEGIICSGPRRGKQFTYALVAERAPKTSAMSGDEALATLTRRYLQSHGPATVRDFVWWSGVSTAEARRGLDIARARRQACDGLDYFTVGRESRAEAKLQRVHLLPIYDEYTVAYRDRVLVPHGSISFRHTLVVDGKIGGTWRVTSKSSSVNVEVMPRGRLDDTCRRAQERAVERYSRFMTLE